jgi:hypothetical protein
MNALIFLVPEDIVDVRPRLVRVYVRGHIKRTMYSYALLIDPDIRG